MRKSQRGTMKYTLKNVRRNLVSLRKGTLYTRRWVSNQVSDPRGPENAHAATTLLPSLGIPLPAPRWPGPYTVQKLRSSKVTHLLSRTLTAGRICDSSSSKSSKIHNTGLRPGQSPKLNKERYLQEHFNPALLKKKKVWNLWTWGVFFFHKFLNSVHYAKTTY